MIALLVVLSSCNNEDVLTRYIECIKKYPEYDIIVRITGDCPLIDPVLIDETISKFVSENCDYVSNIEDGKETYPDGMDIEVFSRGAIERAGVEATMGSEREHVTLYSRNSDLFSKSYLAALYDFSHFRLTVDEKSDYEVVKFVIENSDISDGYMHYISILTKNPNVWNKNLNIMRNEGLVKSLQQEIK